MLTSNLLPQTLYVCHIAINVRCNMCCFVQENVVVKCSGLQVLDKELGPFM